MPRIKTTARGYGWRHQQLRKQLARSVEAGHYHDRGIYRGPEHKRCNLSAGGRQNGGVPPIERRSRVW